MVVFRSQYVSGETIKVSFGARVQDEACSVVLSCGSVKEAFDCVKIGRQWVALVDTGLLGVNKWVYAIWRVTEEGREVIARGTFEVVEETAEFVSPIEEARNNIDVLKKARMGVFGNGVKRNRVRDREVERFSPVELLEELRYWEEELYRLELAAGLRRRKNMQFYC